MKFALGGSAKDFNSKKARGECVNLFAEGDGDYRTVRKCEGLTLFSTLAKKPVRSIPFVNSGFIYVVSGTDLYKVDSLGISTSLGEVGGIGRASIFANALPGGNQVCILNGSGAGFIYTISGGLVKITDVDFFPSTSGTVLDERFWFARDGSNEFFGSGLSNGLSYNPLTFGTADESSDKVVAVVKKKSALWVLGEQGLEYWQRFSDPDFPLRSVNGGTKEYGILAKDSLAEMNDYFAFLADDRTVRLVQGSQIIEISDLDFKTKLKGNGTPSSPGFSVVTDAVGFFVDGPIHSTYYLSFPAENYTWGFDIKTKMSHTRASEGDGYWRVNGATKFEDKVICGDRISGSLWELDVGSRNENGTKIRTKLVSPSISFPNNITISSIEIDMEVAQNTDPDLSPQMMVWYTKNGGNTWINKGETPIGEYGQHGNRVVLRQFGRLVRHKDFALRLEITDDVGVQFYGAEMKFEASI